MANFKIVEVEIEKGKTKETRQVLLQRVPGDNGNDVVQISAYIDRGDEGLDHVSEEVVFEGIIFLSGFFIDSFGEEQALEFIQIYE